MSDKVMVAGHICLDITPIFLNQEVNSLDKILEAGKLVEMKDVDVHAGGCVSNTGLAIKKFGAEVSFVAKIGNDYFGKIVQSIFRENGADESLMVSENVSTSYSIVIALPGMDRIFLHNPGANSAFIAEDIDEKKLENTALLHFGYPSIMKLIYEKDGYELVKIFQKAKRAGTLTSLDMAAVDPSSEAGKVDWRKVLENVLPYVDFFAPSIEELCFMLDRPHYESLVAKADGKDMTGVLDIEQDVKPLAEMCIELGAKVLIIKCGSAGIYYCSAKGDLLESLSSRIKIETWAGICGFQKSFKVDRVLSGTGAGDTSIAAFLISMLNGKSFKESVTLAAATGACCVEQYDALSGIKSLEQIQARIDAGWEENELHNPSIY